MTRMPRVRVATLILALIAGLAIWFVFPVMLALARQSASPVPVEVGSGPIRERSLELIGRNIYHPDSVEMFGYLTNVIGLDSSMLFTDDTFSEGTARLTYTGNVSVSSRADRGDVTAFEGEGVLQVYLDDTGASWDDPGSFGDGQLVAELSIQLHDTLHRQAPGIGVLIGDGELGQDRDIEFTLGGEVYRFGQNGIEQRLRYVGTLSSGGAQLPSFVVSLNGNTSVVAREATPVNVGQPAATAATPTAAIRHRLQPLLDRPVDDLIRALRLSAAA